LTLGRAAAADRVVTVKERDFRIAISTHRVAPGAVTFRITNVGPDAHELILIRADHGLPLRSDGITVDEEALATRTVGTLEPLGEPGLGRRDRRPPTDARGAVRDSGPAGAPGCAGESTPYGHAPRTEREGSSRRRNRADGRGRRRRGSPAA